MGVTRALIDEGAEAEWGTRRKEWSELPGAMRVLKPTWQGSDTAEMGIIARRGLEMGMRSGQGKQGRKGIPG